MVGCVLNKELLLTLLTPKAAIDWPDSLFGPKEIDLTNVVPAVDTTIGAIAGPFEKGPVSKVVTITSEADLVNNFGKPNASNFEFWFTASNFLKYSNTLKVVRAESGFLNAGEASGVLIQNDDVYHASYYSETGDGQVTSNDWYARTAGTHGNSLRLEVCPSATAYEQDLGVGNLVNGAGAVGDDTITVDDITDISIGSPVGGDPDPSAAIATT